MTFCDFYNICDIISSFSISCYFYVNNLYGFVMIEFLFTEEGHESFSKKHMTWSNRKWAVIEIKHKYVKEKSLINT